MNSLIKLLLTASTIWSAVARADVPTVHGMLLFGDKVNFASHLPMFHAPHDYQLILKLTFQNSSGSQALEKYAAAKLGPQSLFTLVPEVMDLTKIMDGTKTTFKAAIFMGHFERGGQNLGQITVQVDKITFSTKLNAAVNVPENKYLVFGEGDEFFAAHIIKGKPSYDAVLQVSKPMQILFPHCRTRLCDDPVETPIEVQLPLVLDGPSPGEASQVPQIGGLLGNLSGPSVNVKKLIYFEEAELSH